MIRRHATGGSISGILPRLSDAELQVTQSQNNTGNVRRRSSLPSLRASLMRTLYFFEYYLTAFTGAQIYKRTRMDAKNTN